MLLEGSFLGQKQVYITIERNKKTQYQGREVLRERERRTSSSWLVSRAKISRRSRHWDGSSPYSCLQSQPPLDQNTSRIGQKPKRKKKSQCVRRRKSRTPPLLTVSKLRTSANPSFYPINHRERWLLSGSSKIVSSSVLSNIAGSNGSGRVG